jgi:hypothetical protein
VYYAWTSTTNWGYDMAVVQLRYSYHNLIGTTYMQIATSDTYGARIMNTAGYPTVKGYGSMCVDATCLCVCMMRNTLGV